MYAIELGGPSIEELVRVERADPASPRRGQLLLRVRAASLNYLDVAVATGLYPRVAYPLTPLADGAGEILEIGEEVEGFAVGDRVAIHPKARWFDGAGQATTTDPMRGVSLPGCASEYMLVSADTVVKAPRHLTWEGIAALPIAATTAWRGVEAGNLAPGATAVLLGTGGVSIFALQFAKARGARVIILSSSNAKLERARALGADHGINYRAMPAWPEAVRELTGGIGADLVIETVGAETIDRSLQSLRQNGTIFTIGFLGGSDARVDLLKIMSRAIRLQGSTTGSVAHLSRAMAAIEAHDIEPIIDRAFPIAEIREAYAAASSGAFGKTVLRFDW